VTFAAGSSAVQVTVASTGGTAITKFAQPLDLQFPNAPGGSFVPAYSHDGVTWTAIPQITSPPTLPDGWSDGWYRDVSGTLHILTLHATYFGLLAAGTKVQHALGLAFGVRRTIDLDRTHSFVLHLQPTLPAKANVVLTRAGRTVGSWSAALTLSPRALTITIPKRARKLGTESLRITVSAAGETISKRVTLKLVAKR
jgi:hypothetical protein